jgi:hypothetical protein
VCEQRRVHSSRQLALGLGRLPSVVKTTHLSRVIMDLQLRTPLRGTDTRPLGVQTNDAHALHEARRQMA